MKTQHKCMTLATSFPTPDAQPPPRLRATHVRSLRWLDCPECDSIYPPHAIRQLTITTLGVKAIWRDASAPCPVQNVPSLNGHPVETGALPKRAYRCFASTDFKHAIWRDTSAPSLVQNVPSPNGHPVKSGALPKRAYRCFAGTAFKHAIWRDASAPCPVQNVPSPNGHPVKSGALSKRAYTVFCKPGFQARHLVRARCAQRLLEPHAGNPPRGYARCTPPARTHTKFTTVVHGTPRGHLTRDSSNELARQTLAHIDVILGNISLRLWVLGKGQRHREVARCLCPDAPRRTGNPRFDASTFSRRNF